MVTHVVSMRPAGFDGSRFVYTDISRHVGNCSTHDEAERLVVNFAKIDGYEIVARVGGKYQTGKPLPLAGGFIVKQEYTIILFYS